MAKTNPRNLKTAEIMRNAAAQGTASAIKEFVLEAIKAASKYGHLRSGLDCEEMKNILAHALRCALCAAAWLEELESSRTANGEE